MILTKSYKPEVLEKWHAFFENFQMSSLEFYEMVRKELADRKVPGLKMSHVKWKEGGLLSDERQYLRLTRERWVFDICAAPFGTGYLFSYRFTELPIKIDVMAILFLLCFLALLPIGVFYLFRSLNGSTAFTVIVVFILVGLATTRLRSASTSGDFDSMLLQIPGLGPLYDQYFRQHTYYREDTRLMYLATVPAIVKMLTDKVTAAAGVKQPLPADAKPIMTELSSLT